MTRSPGRRPWDEVNERRSTGVALDQSQPNVAPAFAPEPAKSTSLPPLNAASRFVKEADLESLSSNIRPLGQLDESFIVATDDEGLLLIDQHVAHERILFDKYRALESDTFRRVLSIYCCPTPST